MSTENVDAVRRSFDGWNRGDVDAWLESAHPDIEWSSEIARRIEGTETVVRGTAAMRRFWDEWHSVWDMKVDVSEVRDLGETVLVIARLRAHGEASGVDLEGPVAYVFEFDGNLARTVRGYLNPQQALEAVGLS
jgi:ketosteroid isomerase-like protein